MRVQAKFQSFSFDKELSVTDRANPLPNDNEKDYLIPVASMVNSVKTQ